MGVCAAIATVGWVLHPAISVAGIVGAAFVLFFFRDPERTIVAAPGQIVAPADGKVVAIDEVEEQDYIGGRCRRIGIFLSILDVHINRAPVGGEIELVRHTPGKFAFANTHNASSKNECNLVGIGGDDMRVAVKQIAGAIARRIMCYCTLKQRVRAGDRIGMIKFGSRTELYLPLDCEILVSVGQRVRGGISLVGAYDETVKKEA